MCLGNDLLAPPASLASRGGGYAVHRTLPDHLGEADDYSIGLWFGSPLVVTGKKCRMPVVTAERVELG